MFNLFKFANVIIGPAGINNLNTIYFLGIDATGSPAPRRTDANAPTFMTPEASQRSMRHE